MKCALISTIIIVFLTAPGHAISQSQAVKNMKQAAGSKSNKAKKLEKAVTDAFQAKVNVKQIIAITMKRNTEVAAVIKGAAKGKASVQQMSQIVKAAVKKRPDQAIKLTLLAIVLYPNKKAAPEITAAAKGALDDRALAVVNAAAKKLPSQASEINKITKGDNLNTLIPEQDFQKLLNKKSKELEEKRKKRLKKLEIRKKRLERLKGLREKRLKRLNKKQK